VEHCGIDLHGKSSEVAVVNEAGELVETDRYQVSHSTSCVVAFPSSADCREERRATEAGDRYQIGTRYPVQSILW
jgi:hypothetical protein